MKAVIRSIILLVIVGFTVSIWSCKSSTSDISDAVMSGEHSDDNDASAETGNADGEDAGG